MPLSKNLKAPMYLELFHGRKDPEEGMEDWGEDGPIFPIHGFVHCTYMWDIKLDIRDNGGYEGELTAKANDLLHYDGMYYGDWTVFPAERLKTDHRVQEFNPAKAEWPKE